MYDRVIKLIGEDNFNKINSKKILLVGVGGVGSFVFEALIRTGFNNITIIDKDKVDITNLNRQLIATTNTLNVDKVASALSRSKSINDKLNIKTISAYLSKDNMDILDKDYDYIIDCCDTLNTKVELIRFATTNNIKIITSLGMGNRIDASNIKITKLNKTSNDPLAKKLRKLLKDNELPLNTLVAFNSALPIKKGEVNSIITSPGIAGLLIVDYIIKDIIL